MNIEEEMKDDNQYMMRLVRVNGGDVFHFADISFEEAMKARLFFMLTDLPMEDDMCTIVHLATGGLFKYGADIKVVRHRATIKVTNEPIGY